MNENGKVVKAAYCDKVVFENGPNEGDPAKWKQTIREVAGKWKEHPVFRGKTVAEIIEYLRGPDCDA